MPSGAMPWKLKPGTPSMLAGKMIPCQWIDVSWSRRFFTRRVTVSPSRQRSNGPGNDPLMVIAVRGEPVMFTGLSPINRSNSLPESTLGIPGLVTAHTGVRQRPRPPRMPPAAKPFTNVRLEVLECMPLCPISQKGSRAKQQMNCLDETHSPLQKTNSNGKRAQKLPHLNHHSDYISVSL